ncbi:MAG: WXG100 family type VII secretion target [Clostridia bacterium]|nr:WXG100 family type VII secretion target [Clostridia bacterium]
MARKITVTPEFLTSASEKIETIAMDYQKVYMKLYTEIESMKSAWDGADNIAFTTQVQGFEDDFQLMYRLMLEYASFLRMSAKAYQQTQDDIVSAAGGLSTGNDKYLRPIQLDIDVLRKIGG